MKLNYISLVVVLISILLFTACNKNNEALKPIPQTSTQQTISGQIVLNLVQSLSGAYGGIDLKSGISKPAFANEGAPFQISRFHSLNNSLNSLCSFFVDSALSYDTNIADTIKSHTGGKLKFYFSCNNGVSIGYTASDSLITAGKAPGYSFYYVVNQNYLINSLNIGNTLLSVNGNVKTDIDLTYPAPTVQTIVSDYYVLNGLTIDLTNNGDITGGSAGFTSIGGDKNGAWNLNGTIVFFGNHKADINVNGTTYHVDLVTGKVS
ncbi:MAG TPA: hypothetical protein VGN20_12445 [Mucilaginibacter sp.]|jgi:hypothetical protein